MTEPGTWIRFSHTTAAECFDITAVQLTEQQVSEATKNYAAQVTRAEGEAVLFTTWPANEPELTVIYVRQTPSTQVGTTARDSILGPDLRCRLGLETGT